MDPLDLDPDAAWGLTFWDRGRCRRQLEALRADGIYTPPSLEGSLVYPSPRGGVDWGGMVFDASRGVAVLASQRLAVRVKLYRREDVDAAAAADPRRPPLAMDGTPYVAIRHPVVSPLGLPCNPPPWGTLMAVDVGAGRIRWEVPLGRRLWVRGLPLVGGPIVTAGGLVFVAASMDSRLRAFDVGSGVELWSAPLPASGQATPMTYAVPGDPRGDRRGRSLEPARAGRRLPGRVRTPARKRALTRVSTGRRGRRPAPRPTR